LFFVEVMMGDGNLVECAVIKATKEARPVVIGSGNVFEDKCVLENCQVGDYCVIGSGAKLVDCTLIAGNVVAPKVELKVKRKFWFVEVCLYLTYKTITKGEVLDVNELVYFGANGEMKRQIVPNLMERNKASHAGVHAAIVKVMQTQKLKSI
jgi:carbonic anhydrase/acetyltransferase-like protein (isoleucine patch superfamily)